MYLVDRQIHFYKGKNMRVITKLFIFFFIIIAFPAFAQIQNTSEYQTAIQALANGDYSSAADAIQPLLAGPHKKSAMVELGKIRQRQAESEISSALNHFYEAANMLSAGIAEGGVTGPEAPKLIYDLANIYEERLKDYPKAIEMYELLIANYPTFMTIDKVHYNLAACYEAIGKYAEASENYSIVVANYSYSTYFKSSQEKMKRLAIGTSTQESALELQENLADEALGEHELQANIDLGDMQADAGQYKKAAEAYKNALKAVVDSDEAVDVYRKLVNVLEGKQKDYKGATEAIEEMMKKYPNAQGGEDLIYRLGRIYETDLDSMKKTVDSSGNIRYRKSRENMEKAIDYYSAVTDRYPYSDAAADAYLRKGEILSQEFRDYDAAKDVYETFLKRFPDHAEVRNIRRKLEDLEGY